MAVTRRLCFYRGLVAATLVANHRLETAALAQPGAQAQAGAIVAGGGPQQGYQPHPCQPKRQHAAFSTRLTLSAAARTPCAAPSGAASAGLHISAPAHATMNPALTAIFLDIHMISLLEFVECARGVAPRRMWPCPRPACIGGIRSGLVRTLRHSALCSGDGYQSSAAPRVADGAERLLERFLSPVAGAVPVALYPATTETERTRLHQINRRTGHRIRYVRVDAKTGQAVGDDDLVMGYEVARGRYVPISEQELEAIAPESRQVIDIDEFVPQREVDELVHLRPYYVAPDGAAGQDAFAVLRDTIARMGRVALGRVVLTNREHVIALERRGKGMVGMLLRYPHEIRRSDEIFAGIADVTLPRDTPDLAERTVEARSGHFRPEKLEDHYERDCASRFAGSRKANESKPHGAASRPTSSI
jgi:DNA end-binding protein Ku